MSTTVFPVDGAANAAELFALLAGHANATDFVDEGLTVSVDTDANTATLSSGTCYIRLPSDTVVGTDKQVRNLGYAVQLDQQTVSIPTGGTVTLAVVPDYTSPNIAAIEHYATQSDVPAGALSIATVDCDAGTVSEYNRAPDIEAESLSVLGGITVSETATFEEDLIVEGELQSGDGTTLLGPDANIPVSALKQSDITIQTSGDITGGGSVALGDSITLGTDVPVTSVHGRTGAVLAAAGDYTHGQIADVSVDDHHAYPVPNGGLVNASVTVTAGGDLTGGGSVALGDAVTLSADVHERYTDTEAVSAVDSVLSAAASSVSDLDTQVQTNVSNIGALQSNKLDQSAYDPESDTHTRYGDGEAVSAVDGAISAAASSVSNLDAQVNTNVSDISALQSSKLDQSEYTPEADTHEEFTASDAITAIDGEITSTASTVSALDTQVSTNTTDISALQSGKLDQSAYKPESDTHAKYTDSEAVAAIDAEVSAAASTISALDTAVSSNSSDISSLQSNKLDASTYAPESDTHSRYADSEAVSAVDSEVTDTASSVSGLDTAVNNNNNDISALQNQAHAEQHGSGQHNTDSLHTDGVVVPSYPTKSDVPSLPEGTLVYIEDTKEILVEDGT